VAWFRPVLDSRPDDVAWPRLNWPPRPGLHLCGSAIELTPLEPDRDSAELFALLNHDVVWKHLPIHPRDPGEFAAHLTRQRDAGRLPFLVRLRQPIAGLAAGTAVGTSSYLDIAVADARLEIGSTIYAPAVWASAVNPDTKLQLLGHAFDVLGAGRVQFKTDVRNVRSQQAIARLGARYEGTLRRHIRRFDGTMRDSVVFSVVAEEWPFVRARLIGRVTSAVPD
jgi:RimJ/RimL family protein N-acetyltransferase